MVRSFSLHGQRPQCYRNYLYPRIDKYPSPRAALEVQSTDGCTRWGDDSYMNEMPVHLPWGGSPRGGVETRGTFGSIGESV